MWTYKQFVMSSDLIIDIYMVFKKFTVGLQNETETDEHWMMFLETSIDVHCITNTLDGEN